MIYVKSDLQKSPWGDFSTCKLHNKASEGKPILKRDMPSLKARIAKFYGLIKTGDGTLVRLKGFEYSSFTARIGVGISSDQMDNFTIKFGIVLAFFLQFMHLLG